MSDDQKPDLPGWILPTAVGVLLFVYLIACAVGYGVGY